MRIDDLSTSTKVAGFAVGLAAVFAVALGVGSLTGSQGTTAATAGHGSTPDGEDGHGHSEPAPGSSTEPAGGHPSPGTSGPASELPGGLAVSQQGYSLRLAAPTATAG